MRYRIGISFIKMKFRDLIICILSFIFGCVVTLNFTRVYNISKDGNSEDLVLSISNANSMKLYSAINYYLIIVILSGAENVIQRTAIRESWGLMNNDYADVQYFFIIGSYGLSHDKLTKLQNEQIKYNDLFLLSVADNYTTLTKRILQAFVWFGTEFNFKYILKCDDDSFVVIPRVIDELQNTFSKYEHLYWGYFDGRAHVKQTGKWKETNWFLCDRYLPYALGGGYVLSRSLVHYIKENEHILGTYLSEDVSVGVWLAPLNITRYHDVRFNTEYMSRGCNNSYIITHKQSPGSMKSMYSSYIKLGKLCIKESRTRNPYEYNWNVLPTKCCLSPRLLGQKYKFKELSNNVL